MSLRAALPRWVGHGAFLVLAGALLLAAGRPIATDDLWWHAALGRAYAAQGPWLEADPLLYTAPAPPAPSAWLFDTAVFALGRAGGFDALRALHVSLVAAVLGAAWWLLRRASGSALVASAAAATFVPLAAYRLAQLRPHLLTILAVLLLYALVIEDRGVPSRGRVLTVLGLLALWANLHAAFVLGPVLLAVSLAGLLLALPLQSPEARRRDRRRAGILGATLGLGLLATLANPDGGSRYLDFLEVGSRTPGLGLVIDEWRPLHPLRLPQSGLPPSPLAWGLFWVLLLGVPLAAVRAVRAWGRDGTDPGARIDPALVALALAALAAPLLAVRLLWLPIFALLLLARSVPARSGHGTGWRGPVVCATASLLLAVGFFGIGDWRRIAGSFPALRASLARPYEPGRYHAHAVWLLKDAGLQGNVFNEYRLGGFLGFWLAPRLRGSASGTLNVSLEALEANQAIRLRRGVLPGEDFLELLDRQQVDVFLGTGLPIPAQGSSHSTTAHLEGAPGWLLAFRNPRSAVYLRDSPRNRTNLAALETWYAREGVPFDARRGFEVERVIREAPAWARDHGVVPLDFGSLQAMAEGLDPLSRPRARDQLASLYAALGLYERAIRLDAGALARDPGAVHSRRRLVWALLRAGRADEALRAAQELPEPSRLDPLTRQVFAAARRHAELPATQAAALVARLPLFGLAEASRLGGRLLPPRPRSWPRASAHGDADPSSGAAEPP